ncbi:uncharacterized protein YbjT (DUF2867 family) [Luteibacter rhizovicinus]|uniref:Uncharacterized protein YbjT (DUF2867 family) n=1 Tax=Luteibacter rhizovicinus TaxID=242606 RepID=A0A4R3YVN2_9GAMM|nr:NmrA/HSCARG family protein [Luteibacter rhizovicinus]TCV97087.1 uncharacterized protein YbjT (DUF2867 family) [Luteibacter rhizovicinus]
MTILVTGSTGTIGSLVVNGLAAKGARVRALARDPAKATFPAGVSTVKGDMTDVSSLRAAMEGVDTLFLLNAVTADEVTQAIIALSLARDAGIERIVYFSVFHADTYVDVPHFTGKYTAERMIEQLDLPATILRPNYFMQNDLSQKDMLLGNALYPMPIGEIGLSMVDVRDIAEVAIAELLRRENAPARLPRQVIELVGPEPVTATGVAKIWSDILGKPIVAPKPDADAFEAKLVSFGFPSWTARDIRLMTSRFQLDGMVATKEAVAKMTALLGHAPRSYRDFAIEAARTWEG